MAAPLSEEDKYKQEREKYVKLISAEGVTFIIERKAANVSNTVKSMLGADSGFLEAKKGEITFSELTAPVLEKVCQYFYFKLRYQNMPTKSIPDFAIPPAIALELLKAANFLDT